MNICTLTGDLDMAYLLAQSSPLKGLVTRFILV